MKKICALASVMLMVVSLIACGGGPSGPSTTTRTGRQAPRIQVLEQMGDSSWVMDGVQVKKVAQLDNQKCIIFVGSGTAEDRDTALEIARNNVRGEVALAIKALATKQVARAMESVGTVGNEPREQVFRMLEATKAKNVNVAGLNELKKYYRLVKKANFPKEFYEFYVQMAMEYQRYTNARDGIINTMKRSYQLNQNQQRLMNETSRVLNELDRAEDGGVPGGNVELTPTQRQAREEAVPGQQQQQ